jgi:hypothetical protein
LPEPLEGHGARSRTGRPIAGLRSDPLGGGSTRFSARLPGNSREIAEGGSGPCGIGSDSVGLSSGRRLVSARRRSRIWSSTGIRRSQRRFVRSRNCSRRSEETNRADASIPGRAGPQQTGCAPFLRLRAQRRWSRRCRDAPSVAIPLVPLTLGKGAIKATEPFHCRHSFGRERSLA